MRIKNSAPLAIKIWLLVALLLASLVLVGCFGVPPRGWSGGAVAEDTLFLGSMDGEFLALKAESGARLWQMPIETETSGGGFGCAPAPTSVAIYGTPAVGEELVYFGGYNGKVYALNTSSGALRWVYPRQGNLEPIAGGAVVALGKLYIGSSDGKLYALDAATGDEIWQFETGDKVWSTPVIDGNRLFIASFDKKLYALDAATGDEIWQFETEGAIVSTPVVHNSRVYIGSFDRHLYALDAASGRKIWQFPSDDEAEGGPGNWFWAKPIVHNNTLYAVNLDGRVYILSAETGSEVASTIDIGSPLSSWPVLADSSVIIASEEGTIYALDTATNQVKPLANLDEKVYAPLAASDGVVYVHTQENTLYALSAQTGVTLWSLPLSSK
ncbi:MAG: dehydrogenase [Dehalococcoidia bacterium]|nr:MAG: dehydrogenase [Dehalococcoidia bacterium]